MRRNAFTLIELVVVVAILLILAAILLPVFQRTRCDDRGASCRSNLKRIALGLSQYLQDYDEKLPPLVTAKSGGWADSLLPYLKNWEPFQCPSAALPALRTTDYFFNSRLAKLPIGAVWVPARTVSLGDGRDNAPANSALSHLPQEWRGAPDSPAVRHLRNQGANYAFADGHAKYLKPEQLTSKTPNIGVFTFALR